MFSISPAAAQQILQTAQESNATHLALRLAARDDAEGTTEYGMGFDTPQEGDVKLNLSGVAVVYQPAFSDALDDVVLDFVEMNPSEFHFIFVDAAHSKASNAGSAGGCGTGGCGGNGNGNGGGGCGSNKGCS